MIECAQYIFDTFRIINMIFILNTWKTLIKYHITIEGSLSMEAPPQCRTYHFKPLLTWALQICSGQVRQNTVKIFKTHMLQMWVLIKSQAIYYSLDPKSTRWHPPCLPGYPPTPFETLLKPLLHSRLTFSWMYKAKGCLPKKAAGFMRARSISWC